MRRITILFVCLFVFAAAVSSGQSAPKYQIIDLGVLPGYTISEALGINDSGTVVGYCIHDHPTLPVGFIWTQQTGMVPITMPPGDVVAVPRM